MAKSAILDVVPGDRRKTIFWEEDGITRIESRQDVDPIIKAASIMSEREPGKDWRHMALVPVSELNRAYTEGWFHDEAAWKRWLNDPANACYRTWAGRA